MRWACGLEWVGRSSRGHRANCGFLCRRAKLLLKKKRYREQLLDRTENQISSLEAMVSEGVALRPRGWDRLAPPG